MGAVEKVLLIGGGAREHAIGEVLCRSERNVQLITVAHNYNPGLAKLGRLVQLNERDVDQIARLARDEAVDLAVIGLEDPLDAGLPDVLEHVGVPTVGPIYEAARLETSKLFTRELMKRHNIPGQVEYHYFSDADSLAKFLFSSGREFALKPIGLTAGKGVKVMGVQLDSTAEAVQYGREVIGAKIGGVAGVIAEERLIGQEFTLQAFVDGRSVVSMPLVQDYKRAFDGDKGPNTGSMGSYSQPDGLLPFVDSENYDQALGMLRRITGALRTEGHPYRGVMYGQFMMTAQGIKLVEINARFGDPEAINVLPLLQTDMVEICEAIVSGTLDSLEIQFAKRATVCKYITPPGYPLQPKINVPLRLDRSEIEALGVRVYFAKVNSSQNDLLTTTSRSIALVGIADSVEAAEVSVRNALMHVHGEYHVRQDIGTQQLIQRSSRIDRPLVARLGS